MPLILADSTPFGFIASDGLLVIIFTVILVPNQLTLGPWNRVHIKISMIRTASDLYFVWSPVEMKGPWRFR
jgi:hypothetical protein